MDDEVPSAGRALRTHSEGDIEAPQQQNIKKRRAPFITATSFTFGEQGRLKSAKKHWRLAVLKVRKLRDPFKEFGFDQIKEETVTRHMYNPRTGRWKSDEIVIKMQSEVYT